MSTNTAKPTDAANADTAAATARQQQAAASTASKKAEPSAPPKTAASAKPAAAPKAPAKPVAAKAKAPTKDEPQPDSQDRKSVVLKSPPRVLKSTKAVVNTNMMVTLDLTGEFAPAGLPEKNNLSKALAKVTDNNGVVHNLFAPFRGVSEKARKKDPTAARGLIRSALSSIMGITHGEPDATLIGDVKDVFSILNNLSEQLRDRVQAAIGFQPSDVVFVYDELPVVAEGEPAPEVEFKPVEIVFGDLIRVSAWASIGDLDVADPEATLAANIVVNLTVRAGSIFAADELDVAVQQAITFMETVNATLNDKFGTAQPLMVGILNRANSVGDANRRALFDALDAEGYDAVDRRELLESGSGLADWLCADHEMDTKLLVRDADILHMNVLGVDEEEEAEVESDADGE